MDLVTLNLQDAGVVRDLFREGAKANLGASCRKGSIDSVAAPGVLIATGDLHDNPLHMARVIEAAGMGAVASSDRFDRHVTLHEIIHPPRLINGMDFSFRALARVAALKAAYPQRVHTLLGNHELAQVLGTAIVKDGVRVVDAFNAGLDFAYADHATEVAKAIHDFVMSMPIALRCECLGFDKRAGGKHVLCSHSLPSPGQMARFDSTILDRDLEPKDYEPLRGAAYNMVWGRSHDAELLEDLTERWGINMFIIGHEHAETGVRLVPPNAVILNSDHERGVYLPVDFSNLPRLDDIPGQVVSLASC
ncbi:MAG: hypothetical protein AABZ53_07840 [Planctomycetota bacterium]